VLDQRALLRVLLLLLLLLWWGRRTVHRLLRVRVRAQWRPVPPPSSSSLLRLLLLLSRVLVAMVGVVLLVLQWRVDGRRCRGPSAAAQVQGRGGVGFEQAPDRRGRRRRRQQRGHGLRHAAAVRGGRTDQW